MTNFHAPHVFGPLLGAHRK